MILKARPMTTFAWTYFDGIERATVWYSGSDDPRIPDISSEWDLVPLEPLALDASGRNDVAVVDCVMRTGPNKRVVVPSGQNVSGVGFAFLMNDSGRTVERL